MGAAPVGHFGKRSAKGGANASIGRRPHSDSCVIFEPVGRNLRYTRSVIPLIMTAANGGARRVAGG